MAAIFQLRRGTSNVTLADGELYLHKGSGSIQFGSGSSNVITLLPLDVPAYGNVNLIGNISASGDVRIGGNIYLGNASADNIQALGQFTTNLIPNGTIDIGTTSAPWTNVYANRISASVITGSFSGSINGVEFTTFSTSVDVRLDQLETDSGSQNTRITGLESKATTLQTYTASVNTRIDQLAIFTGSYATTGSNVFVGNQNITGSFIVSGSNIELKRDWPAVGTESHFLRLAPFTSSTGRYYDGLSVGVEHWNDGEGTYEHSLLIHSFDDDTVQNYGAELNVGPYRTHMRVYPSGSNGSLTNVSVQELSNGKTQALVYGDYVQIGALVGQDILIGNTGSLITVSGSNMLLHTPLTSSYAIVSTLFSGSISGIGNVTEFSSSISNKFETISNVTTSFDNRLDRLEESTQSLNDYSQSLKDAIDVTGGDTRIKGNLIVDGTQTSLNTTNTYVEDKSITLASGSTNSSIADGAGFNIAGANVSMSWEDGNQRLYFNTNLGIQGSISSSTIIGLNGVSVNVYSTSVDSRLSNLQSKSASVDGHIVDINTYTGSNDILNALQTTRIDQLAASTASVNSFSSSATASIVELFGSSSNHENRIDGLETKSNTIEIYTASVDVSISNLNNFTSSQNEKDVVISNITSSYNSFTGSATASIVELFGSSSNHESRIDSLENKSVTLETYTASVENRFTTISEVTTSLNLHTASLNLFTSSTYSNFSQSVDNRLDNLEYTTSILTPEGQAEAFNAINTFTGSANNRLNNLELTSASLNLWSSSLNTTFATDSELTSVSTSISTSIQSLSQSLDGRLDQLESDSGSQNTRINTLETKSNTLQAYTTSLDEHVFDINTKTGSFETKFSTLANYTSSNDTLNSLQTTRIDQLAAGTASVNSFTASADNRLDVIETTYATTGSNTFNGNQIISASVYVTGDMIVYGSSSLQNVTASAVSIGTNTVILNTDTPAVRFGGVSVADSGSGAGVSGSLFWDSLNNNWIYQHPTGGPEGGMSAILISGPKNSGSLGDEAHITSERLMVALGDDHIGNSNIYHNGTITAFAGNLEVTGSTTLGTVNITTLNASNGVVSGSSQVLDILSSLNTYTGSNDTLNSLQTARIDQLAASTASVNSFTSSIDTTIKTKLNVEGVVSGSSQITLSSTTGGGTTANVQFGSLGIGTTASGVSGEIRATGDIVAFYSSDERLKENIQPIQNALSKVESISGNTYDWKEGFETIHSHTGHDLGVIAQEVQSVLPEVVTERETGYLAVDYVKLVPVLIEAIKELSAKVKELENK